MHATGGPIGQHISYLKYLNRRPTSVRQRLGTLRRLERFAGEPLLSLTTEVLHAFVNQRSLGVEARAAAVSHLKGFYGWALDEELLEKDPSHRLQRPHRERRIPRPMPDHCIGRALGLAENPIRQWLYLSAYAGLRACEVAQLRGGDFLLDQVPSILIIRESKGGDPSSVPVAAELRAVALELSRAPGWCFPKGTNPEQHITASQVQKRANTFLHEIGVEETQHQARHWYGSHVYRATGRDLRATQEAMRHRSPVSTAGYTFIDPGDVATALDRLPRLTA